MRLHLLSLSLRSLQASPRISLSHTDLSYILPQIPRRFNENRQQKSSNTSNTVRKNLKAFHRECLSTGNAFTLCTLVLFYYFTLLNFVLSEMPESRINAFISLYFFVEALIFTVTPSGSNYCEGQKTARLLLC